MIQNKLHCPNNVLPSKKPINYCSMNFHSFLSGKFANNLNNNNYNVNISFKTYNNIVQFIKLKKIKNYKQFLYQL